MRLRQTDLTCIRWLAILKRFGHWSLVIRHWSYLALIPLWQESMRIGSRASVHGVIIGAVRVWSRLLPITCKNDMVPRHMNKENKFLFIKRGEFHLIICFAEDQLIERLLLFVRIQKFSILKKISTSVRNYKYPFSILNFKIIKILPFKSISEFKILPMHSIKQEISEAFEDNSVPAFKNFEQK